MKLNVIWGLIIALLLMLGGIGKTLSQEGSFPGAVNEKEKDIDIFLDGTESMKGFVSAPNNAYSRTIIQVENTLISRFSEYERRYYKFGNICVKIDREGFLRSAISLIQTIGRAARNINGRVIMYADKITNSMRSALNETERRRDLQIEFNRKNNITPKTIKKNISDILYISGTKKGKEAHRKKDKGTIKKKRLTESKILTMDPSKIANMLSDLEEEMHIEAKELNFENAAAIRDEINKIKKITNINIKRKK